MQTRYVFRKWTPDEVSKLTDGKERDYLFCWSTDKDYRLESKLYDQLDDIALAYLNNDYSTYNHLSKYFKIKISDSYNDWDKAEIASVLGIKIFNRYKAIISSPLKKVPRVQHLDIRNPIQEETDYNSDTASVTSAHVDPTDVASRGLPMIEDVKHEELPLEEICPIENLDRNSFSNEEFVFTEGDYSGKLFTIISLYNVITKEEAMLLEGLSQNEYIKRFKSCKSDFYDFKLDETYEDGFGLSTISFVLINKYSDSVSVPAREFIFEKIEPKERRIIDRLVKLNFIYEQKSKIDDITKNAVIDDPVQESKEDEENEKEFDNPPKEEHVAKPYIWQSKYTTNDELDNEKINQLVEEKMELLSEQLSSLVSWRNDLLNIKLKKHPSAEFNVTTTPAPFYDTVHTTKLKLKLPHETAKDGYWSDSEDDEGLYC